MEGNNLVVSAIKKAESGDGLILRVYETAGSRAETAVSLLGQRRRVRELNLLEENVAGGDQDTVKIAPFEIKTVRLAMDRVTH